MQSKNLEFVLAQAQDNRQDGAFAMAVARAIEVGTVVPSILRRELKAAGFQYTADPDVHAEYGYRRFNNLSRVIVAEKTGEVIAMGAAENEDEALLHAVLGWFRENKVGDEEAPPGLPIG